MFIDGNPASITIMAGPPSANNTVCQGMGFGGSAYVSNNGTQVNFAIEFHEQYGNKVFDPSLAVMWILFSKT